MKVWHGALAAVVLGVLPSGLEAQARSGGADRIWGTVLTQSGRELQGWIRWDRNEVGWADLLNGSKPLSDEVYDVWAAAIAAGGKVEERSIEFAGFRITWDDERESFPAVSDAGIRFGHLHRLEVTGDQEVLLTLRSGETVEFSAGSTDIGTDMRELLVIDDAGRETELDWVDLHRIDFGPAPAGWSPTSERIHGTVTDRRGNRWTGYIAWDMDEVLGSDVLDAEVDGDEFDLPFDRIARIERDGWSGAIVTTREGTVHEVRGSNDVDDGNRGILVSDPGLGLATIPWDEMEAVDFHPAQTPDDWSAYDGGAPLWGTVELEDGTMLEGFIRWDSDEEWDWEILDGFARDVDLDVEFRTIRRIEKVGADGATVILRDGRALELDESNDVDAGNKGVFVRASADDEWTFVDWYDFRAIDFERGGRR